MYICDLTCTDEQCIHTNVCACLLENNANMYTFVSQNT